MSINNFDTSRHANGGSYKNTLSAKTLPNIAQQIAVAMRDIAFGEITVIIQDGKAIQINRTEKTRLRYPSAQSK
jgi:hypothetical protein